jgi:hypothetical protein
MGHDASLAPTTIVAPTIFARIRQTRSALCGAATQRLLGQQTVRSTPKKKAVLRMLKQGEDELERLNQNGRDLKIEYAKLWLTEQLAGQHDDGTKPVAKKYLKRIGCYGSETGRFEDRPNADLMVTKNEKTFPVVDVLWGPNKQASACYNWVEAVPNMRNGMQAYTIHAHDEYETVVCPSLLRCIKAACNTSDHPWRHAVTRARCDNDDGDDEMTSDDELAAPEDPTRPPPPLLIDS